MPVTRLAKLADMRSRFGATATSNDALYLGLIEAATARCAQGELAGRALTREVLTEYPTDPIVQSRFFVADRIPIESVASIKQAYEPSAPARFDTVDALIEDEDYVVDHERGRIERLASAWYLRSRCLQLVYTAGYGDPANLEVIAVSGNADAVAVRAGEITIGGVDLAYPGASPAADGLANNDTTYVWVSSVAGVATISSAVDATGWPATAHEKLAEVTLLNGAIIRILDRRSQPQPPLDLQQGILAEAIQQFHYRNSGGVTDGSMPGGGRLAARVLEPHPMLASACASLRRRPM